MIQMSFIIKLQIKSNVEKCNIQCPDYGLIQLASMPLDGCLYFYLCKGSHNGLHPRPGDCSVFCSYRQTLCYLKQNQDKT